MTKKIDSLYIHFPFCLHLCNYCDFYKRKSDANEADLDIFHQFLIKSFERHEKLTKEFGYSFVPLKTVYIGGGTPSLWGERGAEFIKEFFKKRSLELDPNCEFTMEVNPKAWTNESLEAFKAIGVNRFSLGIQTLNANIIPYLDRYHDVDDVFETLEYFQKTNANYSMDFMLGLPHSKSFNRDIEKELALALKYNPQHFSVYILTVKDNYKYYGDLPDEDWISNEYLKTAEVLKSRGFNHYEVSNFALSGRQSQHNLNYWKSSTVAALGASATGFLAPDKLRYKWKTAQADLEIETLSDKEFNLEKIYMALRSDIGLQKKFLSNQAEFNSLVNKWRTAGYLKREESEWIQLNSKGFLMLDSLMNDLFPLI